MWTQLEPKEVVLNSREYNINIENVVVSYVTSRGEVSWTNAGQNRFAEDMREMVGVWAEQA
jgi:hypothetical protein